MNGVGPASTSRWTRPSVGISARKEVGGFSPTSVALFCCCWGGTRVPTFLCPKNDVRNVPTCSCNTELLNVAFTAQVVLHTAFKCDRQFV